MNAKQQRAFDNLSRHIYGPMWTFDSSAKILEDKLSALGIASPVRLYYEYRFPDNQDAEQFEHTMQRFEFVIGFNPQQILNTSEYYRAMPSGNISDKLVADIMDYNDELCKICEQDCADLTDIERKELADNIIGLKEQTWHDIDATVSWIKAHNPELESVRVDMKNDTMLLMFLSGVNYGYAPADIDYFINTDTDTKFSAVDKTYAQLGLFDLYPNYIIRPDRAQKILDAVLMARGAKPKDKES